MKCLKCDCEEFEEKNMRFSPEIKGEIVDVIARCTVCKACHSPIMDDEQMNEFRRATADKYRENHGLLTGRQIAKYREALGMSQTAFANYLNVGEASVKRWETYFIQDASQDDHIRLRCDEAYAENNFLNIQWKYGQPDIYSGLKKFSYELFKNIALFLVKRTQADIVILNKLHFYIDFYHFKKFGRSITGTRYVPLKYGPCPDQYKLIYESLEHGGILQRSRMHGYKIMVEPDLTIFDDQEIQTLEHISKLFAEKGGRFLFELSHKEHGYIATEECTCISYDFASDLLI